MHDSDEPHTHQGDGLMGTIELQLRHGMVRDGRGSTVVIA